MNLLIYLTPWKENPLAVKGRSGFLSHWFKKYLQTYKQGLKLSGRELHAKIIYPDNQYLDLAAYADEPLMELIPIKETDIQHFFTSHKNYIEAFNPCSVNKEALLNIAKYFQKKLNTFKPDLIIGLTPCFFFELIWPKTPILVMEAGFFSRAPFTPTQYFDSAPHLHSTFPAQYKEKIASTSNDSSLAQIIFKKSRYEILKRVAFTRNEIDPFNKYKDILLLPLQFEECPSFDHCCNFKNQIELIEYVSQKIEPSTLLLITKHPFTKVSIEEIDRLTKKYKNIRFLEQLRHVKLHLSQYLLPIIDGVITVSSSIGMQAAMWGKVCICIGKSHVQAFSDGEKISDYYSIKSQSIDNTPEKLKLISYLLRHYYIPFKFLWDRPEWVRDFFDRKILDFDSSCRSYNFEHYTLIAEDESLIKTYLSS